MIDIRIASAEDAGRIYELNKHELGYEYPQEKTRKQLESLLHRKQHKILVACSGNMVIGYAHGSTYDCMHSNALKSIVAMVVDRKWQGKGIGKTLLREMENWAKADGCAGIRLTSKLEREVAHSFYESCGYSLRATAKYFIKLF